jgi:flagellar hook-associated protein 1 FlgK
MGGLSQVLTNAAAGMSATQSSLALVSANVANANTAGYVRKTLNQQSIGAGDLLSVQVLGINRELDSFVQQQLRTESSGGAYADLKSQFYTRLQGVYGDPSSSSSLETLFSNFTSAVQNLTVNPSDYSTRAAVLSSAQVLAQQINDTSSQIQGLRSDAELGISNAVSSANDALQGIAQINQKLNASSAQDAASANLLDQRDSLIDQLAQLMDIKVVPTSTNAVSIFTISGIQLVGDKAAQLQFNAQGTITPDAQWSADPTKSKVGTITLVTNGGPGIDLIANNAIRSGQIAAYVEMRDKVLVQAQSQLDSLAAGMSRALSDQTVDGTAVAAGAQNGFTVDLGGLLAGNSIKVNYTDTATNTQRSYTFVRVDDPSTLPLPAGSSTDPNSKVIGIDFSGGMGSVLSQLNAVFGGRIQFSNPSGNTLRILNDGPANTTNITAASVTTTASGLTAGSSQLPFFTDGATPFSGAVGKQGSQIVGYAGRITVNPALLADASKLVDFSGTAASGDSTRPNFIFDQLTTAPQSYSPQTGLGSTTAPFSASLPTFLRQVLSQQGDAASAAQNLSDGQATIVNALQQRLDDTSGVNIDQEMSNLIALQTAYSANARVLTTARDLLDTLLKS